MPLSRSEILGWLRESDETRLAELWQRANDARQKCVGDAVHLRGLIEISNYCVRHCGYCGLNASRRGLQRYRMSEDEILSCAREAVRLGYGTVVMQAGEDYGVTGQFVARIVRRIKVETPLAVTLSLGERPDEDLALWRDAGADRYLLRFETSDPQLYDLIHPASLQNPSDRLAIQYTLRGLGYEVGSGVKVGIRGQNYDSLADDLETFRRLNLDMIGIGPYIQHPDTPLALRPPSITLPESEQAPNSDLMTCKVVALSRLMCPYANIPSTTALAILNQENGRELGLSRGANVVMPNLTPIKYRALYDIYPDKDCIIETAEEGNSQLHARIEGLGRSVGTGPGNSLAQRH